MLNRGRGLLSALVDATLSLPSVPLAYFGMTSEVAHPDSCGRGGVARFEHSCHCTYADLEPLSRNAVREHLAARFELREVRPELLDEVTHHLQGASRRHAAGRGARNRRRTQTHSVNQRQRCRRLLDPCAGRPRFVATFCDILFELGTCAATTTGDGSATGRFEAAYAVWRRCVVANDVQTVYAVNGSLVRDFWELVLSKASPLLNAVGTTGTGSRRCAASRPR